MSQKLLWGIVGVVVIVLVVWGLKRGSDQEPSASVSPSTSPTVSGATTPRSAVVPGVSSAALPASYGDAVKLYGGFRIQFGMYCEATPNRLVVKNGQKIMLDNRSGDARAVTLGTAKYQLQGYGWWITTITAKTFPTTLLIDCGGAQNVGQIIVER